MRQSRRDRSSSAAWPGTALAGAILVFGVAYASGPDPGGSRKLALLFSAILAAGILAGFLPRAWPGSDARGLLTGLGLLLLLTIIGLLETASAERTLDEVARVAGYLALALLGLVAVSRREWGALAAGIAIGAASVCVLGVGARLFPSLGTTELSGLAGGRLAYPLGYWNAVAAWGAMTVALLLACAVEGRSDRVRAWALGALPVAGTCIYLTYSRGGVVASLIGAGVVVAFCARPVRALAYGGIALAATGAVIAAIRAFPEIAHALGGQGGLVVAAVLLAGCLACAGFAHRFPVRPGARRPVSLPRPRARGALVVIVGLVVIAPALYSTVDSEEPVAVEPDADPAARVVSLDGNRPRYWETALDAGFGAPLTGIGPGTFEFRWSRDGTASEPVRDAHSFYLEQFAELGLAGLLSAVLLAGGALWLAMMPLLRGEARGPAVGLLAAVTAFVSYLAIDWMWESYAVTALAILCSVVAAGVASSNVASQRRRGSRLRPGAGPPPARIAVAAIGLLGLLGAVVQVPGLVTADRTEGALEAVEAGRPDLARDLLADAVDAAPWAARPYAARAVVAAEAGDLEAAEQDMREAIDREQENSRLWLALAEYSAALGKGRAAEAALEEAARLGPRSPEITGKEAEALRERIADLE